MIECFLSADATVLNPLLDTAIDYTNFTEAGAVGIALFVLVCVLIMGRQGLKMVGRVMDMMGSHIDHLNDETEKHTVLLQQLVSGGERDHDLLRDISVTLVSTASAANAAAAAAAAVAAAQAAIVSASEQRAVARATALAAQRAAEREADKAAEKCKEAPIHSEITTVQTVKEER